MAPSSLFVFERGGKQASKPPSSCFSAFFYLKDTTASCALSLQQQILIEMEVSESCLLQLLLHLLLLLVHPCIAAIRDERTLEQKRGREGRKLGDFWRVIRAKKIKSWSMKQAENTKPEYKARLSQVAAVLELKGGFERILGLF